MTAPEPSASSAEPSTSAPPLRSPLHAIHTAAGAIFTEFGGWEMPLRYGSELAEHRAVREAVGIFDLSHMAELSVTGTQAAAFLDAALPLAATALPVSRAKYTMLLQPDGGIIDDLIVYHNAPGEYLIVANAGNRHAVIAELSERIRGFDAALSDGTEAISLVALQGPNAAATLAATAELVYDEAVGMGYRDIADLPYFACMGMRLAGTSVLVARTGYTGEDGFELFIAAQHAEHLWRALVTAGIPFGLVPCGLAARDSLRLEAGMPLYGNELTRDRTPLQVGLKWSIPLKIKTADFIGRTAMEKGLDPSAPVLVGLQAEGRRPVRAGGIVFNGDAVADGAVGQAVPSQAEALDSQPDAVGVITSGTLSPTLGIPIAMAMVSPSHSTEGQRLVVEMRGARILARVVPLPFYRRPEPSQTPQERQPK